MDASDLLATVASVDPADEPHVIAQHVASLLERRLEAIRDPADRVDLVNAVIELVDAAETVQRPTRQLHAMAPAQGPQRNLTVSPRPATPLGAAALLTNAHDEPSLAGELRAELGSADSVDLICAFVRWHGLRLLEDALAEVRRRGVPLRVITTTYLGSTERRALDRLVREYGAEVRVQYDAQRTRLHAKAWLFRRRTGFDTAYVGSSNLSRAALLDGVEWNVRLATAATPALIQKFEATFDSYWADPTFARYDPDIDRDRLDDALAEAAGRTASERVTVSLAGLEVRPFPHQQVMLDSLEAERVVHERHRNLVVAATGTGKTVVAALDYKRLCLGGEQPRLLFVAHRQEILEQARRTYREVLADGAFGELYVAGKRPERWDHVFASVQSLTAYGVAAIPSDAFDIVVIDEFHHALAPTYRALLDHLQPSELLGLTATPERTDGTDVRSLFDGRTAAELRLWDAIGADLLVPFHYFAVADGTDLTGITWRRGRGYDEAELSGVYTGNDARAAIVLREVSDKLPEVGVMRALGFCVSVDHAAYMARVFNEAGVPAASLSGASSVAERQLVLAQLRAGGLNAVFAVDLFNEGLDIPEIDTVLMLRPTESATVFLQQLGRGLRRTPTKPVLTVLDFVGLHRKEFRFADRYRALTGLPRRRLAAAVQDGFPFLPSGCQIVMDRQAQNVILDNVRAQLSPRWPALVAEARAARSSTLAGFLSDAGVELEDVLRSGKRSWTELRRAAALPTPSAGPGEDSLAKRVRALAHVDDPVRSKAYKDLLSEEAAGARGPQEELLARMLYFTLWPGGGHASYDEGLAALRAEPALCSEMAQVVDLGFEAARNVTAELDLAGVPLRVHARYQREEVLAALGYASLSRRPNSFREGVLYVRELDVDAFFVTLRKSEAAYSPTTMYRDYPIDPQHFHWESQSTTTLSSPTGQRYVNGDSTVLLFVREESDGPFGTAPYLFLGKAEYVSHQGERPLAITWRLDQPMPAEFFHAASVAAG
ncbi:DUF3427 domain-containing protein [Nocardioides sp. ChNu-99]|uniref:DUF3427 domain-containing protein n=1 Tax=Nocardioides sp. ChNu-99 TaxID=2839897 RepID=UPI003217BE85|nr:DUF3427 domain-containing protein [Nocardioides sp. ChNu-99]